MHKVEGRRLCRALWWRVLVVLEHMFQGWELRGAVGAVEGLECICIAWPSGGAVGAVVVVLAVLRGKLGVGVIQLV